MYSGYRRRRWLRWALLYFAAVIAIAGIGLVIEAGLDSGNQEPQAIPPTLLPTIPDTAAPGGPSTAATGKGAALTGPLHVIQGTQLVNGVYLGFPHSTAGAVSAADEFATQVVSTLDPDRAAAVMRLTADLSFPDAPQKAADGAVNDRKALGIPATGPVPQGASFVLNPVEYQVEGVTPDEVTVLLLSDFITTTPGQGTVTRIGVFPMTMHWAQADWKVLPTAPRDFTSVTAEPDSPQAASLGWQELQP
jgi:hypothetical protein